ncbi:MAG: hypothetical protein KAV82_16480, partial [Phycisphaerae bacterium]|nr:hypothetical protein [Phycisphaerae bacterium]
STANWTIRKSGWIYNVLGTATWGTQVALFATRGIATPLGDVVAFSPPPNDVNGLLTGLPVAGFTL